MKKTFEVELIHRRKKIRFVSFYLYAKKGTRETGTMRTDNYRSLTPITKNAKALRGYLCKNKNLNNYYRLYLEK